MRLAPSSLRYLACAEIISLNAIARPVFRLRHPLVFPVRCRTVAKGEGRLGIDPVDQFSPERAEPRALDLVGRSNVLPMFGREVIKSQEDVAVFG